MSIPKDGHCWGTMGLCAQAWQVCPKWVQTDFHLIFGNWPPWTNMSIPKAGPWGWTLGGPGVVRPCVTRVPKIGPDRFSLNLPCTNMSIPKAGPWWWTLGDPGVVRPSVTRVPKIGPDRFPLNFQLLICHVLTCQYPKLGLGGPWGFAPKRDEYPKWVQTDFH